MAGYRVVWANEFIPAARETYRANAPTTIVNGADIRTLTAESVLAEAGLKVGELDILDGSPPCASFSTAGKREKGWGQVKSYSDSAQRTDDLFFEYARLLRGIQPRAFVAENVSGLVKGTAKGYFLEILRELRACGYRVGAKLLDAQWLGVPQQRVRLIFVGVREDLQRDPVFPKPLPFRYGIAEALGVDRRLFVEEATGHNSVGLGHHRYVERTGQPIPTILAARPIRVSNTERSEASMEGYAVGKEWAKLRPGEQSSRYFSLVRCDPSRPSPTVTAKGGDVTAASVTHPSEPRKFTIAELRRLCGFPDDFALTGTYAQQWERLGRAVPPPMMAAVAAALRDEVLT